MIDIRFIFYRKQDLNWEIFDGKVSKNVGTFKINDEQKKKMFLISEDKCYSFETLFKILIRKFQDTCSSVVEEFPVTMPCTRIGGYKG